MSHNRMLLLISFFSINYSLADFDTVRIPIKKCPQINIIESKTTDFGLVHAQEWAHLCAAHMSPEEMQITANVLYLLYANAFLDTVFQYFYTPVNQLTQTILWNMTNAASNNDEIAQLQIILKKISLITTARNLYTKMLHTALQYLDQNKITIIDQALEALQLYGQDCARTWADNSSSKISEHLKKCSKTVDEHIQYLHAISNLYKGLSDGELPVILDNKEDKALFILDTLLLNVNQATKSINIVTNEFSDIADKAMAIVCEGITLYKLFYEVILAEILALSLEQQYTVTLFGTHELLEKEQRVYLPNSNDIFDHILKVTHNHTNA